VSGTRQAIVEELYATPNGLDIDELRAAVCYMGRDDTFEHLLKNLLSDKQLFVEGGRYHLSDKAKTRLERRETKISKADEVAEGVAHLERLASAFDRTAADTRRVADLLRRAGECYEAQE